MPALLAFAPLFINIGNLLIGWFVKNEADKAAAQKAFLEAITAHANDALKSVNQRLAEQAQRDDLTKKAKELDNPTLPPGGTKA